MVVEHLSDLASSSALVYHGSLPLDLILRKLESFGGHLGRHLGVILAYEVVVLVLAEHLGPVNHAFAFDLHRAGDDVRILWQLWLAVLSALVVIVARKVVTLHLQLTAEVLRKSFLLVVIGLPHPLFLAGVVVNVIQISAL